VDSGVIFVSAGLPNETYTFKHAIVQDAAYAMLSRQKRQQLHSRFADALENSFPQIIATQPELLAHHLAQAGSIERAIDYLRINRIFNLKPSSVREGRLAAYS